MEIRIETKDGKIYATLVGELDTAAAVQVEQALQPLYKSVGEDIVIDCAGLEYLSSSGLRILLGILKNARAHNGSVTLRSVNDNIKNVFRLTGFINLFAFE